MVLFTYIWYGGPMVLFTYIWPIFCHCFLSKLAKKFAANCTFTMISCFDMVTFPTATFKHITFFIWNLMVDLTSSIFDCMSSLLERSVGNFPALVRPGPKSLGICLIILSEARKKSYFFASFFTSFLFLLSFFRSSTLLWSTSIRSACSQWAALPSIQHLRLGRGTVGRRKVPEKRLSRWGS